VDQRGAYVELGAKSPGFCPVLECSTVRLYNVRLHLICSIVF
jgi:hypothetical protein